MANLRTYDITCTVPGYEGKFFNVSAISKNPKTPKCIRLHIDFRKELVYIEYPTKEDMDASYNDLMAQFNALEAYIKEYNRVFDINFNNHATNPNNTYHIKPQIPEPGPLTLRMVPQTVYSEEIKQPVIMQPPPNWQGIRYKV